MSYLNDIFTKVPAFEELLACVRSGSLPAALNGASGVHKAHIIASLCSAVRCKALVIAADDAEGVRLCSDLTAMGMSSRVYPVRDLSFHPLEGRSHDFEHERIEALCSMLEGSADVIVAVADAAQQLTLPPEQLAARSVILRPGAQVSVERLLRVLTAGSYERTDCVEGAGQFAIRGGIVDLFPPAADMPVRIELWGDEIDTLYSFDAVTQRRCEPVDELKLYPAAELAPDKPEELADKLYELGKALRGPVATVARERLYAEADAIRGGMRPASCDKYLPLLFEREATIFDYLPEDALVFVSEHMMVKERAKAAGDRLSEEVKELLEDGVLCRGLTRFALTESELFGHLGQNTIYLDSFARGGIEQPLKALMNIDARQLPQWDGTVALLLEDVGSMLELGYAVGVLAGQGRAADSLVDDLTAAGVHAVRGVADEPLVEGRVTVLDGTLSAGFDYPAAKAAVITWGRGSAYAQKRTASRSRYKKGSEIQSLSELSVGDYVVHLTHGIGIFGGISKIATEGVTRDYIKITYAKSDVLYVPVTQLDMVSKYIGAAEDSAVKLSHLGGTDWAKQKSRVRKAVKDIAKELIKLYAERMKAKGYAFEPDTEFQRDFEAHFEYEETESQLRCVHEIKSDMERPVPMERLLCGDVGFGKTEVALRAAFKCMVEGRQCALLAPTTILAWQHFQTALRRFEGFPFRIELMSRFRTAKQQETVLSELKKGRVDMVIGTHRIIQKDVEFRDLGLAIIDEEQRFGVAHKERFKELFSAVDILMLSATPIPRTLNMALSGLRDISSLEEAPVDRLPVQTYVMEYDRAVIADAIRRELRRGGQVFYLHNRIGDIEAVSGRLLEMVPDAQIGIAHGRMTEQQISKEWRRMLDHEIDILLCTTIIEAGVDVANANTLIVENADCFGLSQLHQIRGRVGRSSRRAYAYLTFSGRRELTEIAQKRLSAIREFTEFGSGMKIAMRDLELRGAGNILGGEQSGHLDMVGYDLYMRLLSEAVAEEKGEIPATRVDYECTVDLPIEAHIPESYIDATTLRLDVYRMIADIRSEKDASDTVDELIDRFGEPPASVMGLVRVALVRNRAAALGITEIKHASGNLLFYISDANMERISQMVGALPGRVLLSVGAKSYLTVRPDRALSMIENVASIVEAFSAACDVRQPEIAQEQS